MKKTLICLCSAVLLAGAALAESDEIDEELIEEEIHEEEVEILEENIRLDFGLVPLGKDDKGIFIVTASSWYHSRASFGSDEGHIQFEVSGSIEVVDDDTLFLTIEAHVVMKGKGEYAEFNVETSVLVHPGEETEVARMGDKTLVVTATVPKEE